MFKFAVVFLFCQLTLSQAFTAFAEDYPECKARCDTEFTDCANDHPSSDPEVYQAKMADCDRLLLTCKADCEYLKPVENPSAIENNPNIIRK